MYFWGDFLVYQIVHQVVNHDNYVNFFFTTAPHVKLVDIENAIQENTMIECTTTCNNLITWRYDTQIDDGYGRYWYEVIATSKSGNLCTETIALTLVWAV